MNSEVGMISSKKATKGYKLKIESKVPLPLANGTSGAAKYPFAKLKIGQSFWAPVDSMKLSKASQHWRRNLGHRYTVRAEENGSRVWRIE